MHFGLRVQEAKHMLRSRVILLWTRQDDGACVVTCHDRHGNVDRVTLPDDSDVVTIVEAVRAARYDRGEAEAL